MIGRPIVAFTKYLTTPASRCSDCTLPPFLSTPASRCSDYTLAPFLSSLPSYLEDSSDLIRQLNSLTTVTLWRCKCLVAAHNIPIKDCNVAMDLFCRSNGWPIIAPITELSNNSFEAYRVIYHQQWVNYSHGYSYAVPVAAAVIYMAYLEDPLLSTKDLLFYRRFIDDIFFIWSGNLSNVPLSFNNLAPTIKLTWDISRESVIFLDAVISIDPLNPHSAFPKIFETLSLHPLHLLPSQSC